MVNLDIVQLQTPVTVYLTIAQVRRSILRFLCRHALLLQTFVYVPVDNKHCDRWIHQAILAISLDLAGSEGFVGRCRVVKQHDMFQENFEHVPRILFALSCVLVGVFFRELL